MKKWLFIERKNLDDLARDMKNLSEERWEVYSITPYSNAGTVECYFVALFRDMKQ